MILYMLIAASVLMAFLALLVFVGLKAGRGDLIAPPRSFGKRPELPKIAPPPPPPLPPAEERPEIAVTEELLAPSPPAPSDIPEVTEEAQSRGSGSPSDADTLWQDTTKRAGTPLAKTEHDYSKDELVEREVRAMLIQQRRDRAIKYVRSELRMDAAEAEAHVDAIARKTG